MWHYEILSTEHQQCQDLGSLAKPCVTCGESGAKLHFKELPGSSLKSLQANPPEVLAWRRAASRLAASTDRVWQPRPRLMFSPFPQEMRDMGHTSALLRLVLAELSWHHSIVRGHQEL